MPVPQRPAAPRSVHPLLLFAVMFCVLFVLHAPLLRLSYFWDEAGYYIPAARDLMLTGDLIPHSSQSSAHPPLVMAWLAAWWRLSGYTPAVTRTAMMLVAAFTLLGLFRLARRVGNPTVALATVLCTAVYPVFFNQSAMAHIDLAAAGFTFWGLDSYFAWRGGAWRRRPRLHGALTVLYFSLAVLAKETAILAPAALSAWEIVCVIWRSRREKLCPGATLRSAAWLLVPLLPLLGWFAYHLHRTGYLLGNPYYFQYNVAATLHPLRIPIAVGMRIWQLLGYMNMFVLTAAAAVAMTLKPLRDHDSERTAIAPPAQLALAAVVAAYVIGLAVLGGAVLARYMLPVTPLVILVLVSTLWRRLPWFGPAIAVTSAGFALALFINPPWHFAPEDNLAWRDFVLLHNAGDRYVASKYPDKVVLTAWPASDELTRPWLRYVDHPMRVLRLENFTAEQVLNAQLHRDDFDVVLAFSTKYEPRFNLTGLVPAWERLQKRFFDYHRDLTPDTIARLLGARIVYQHSRGGQWIAVFDLEHAENARLAPK